MATNETLKNQIAEQKKQPPQTIQQWTKVYSSQIAKALPSVLTPPRAVLANGIDRDYENPETGKL